MTFDFTVNVAAMIAIAATVGGGIAAWVTMRIKVNRHEAAMAEMEKANSALKAELKNTAERAEKIRSLGAHELAEFKLQVAREYATIATVREVKDEVVAAINRLSDRLDELFSVPRSRRPRSDG
jgi:hypothetical protein